MKAEKSNVMNLIVDLIRAIMMLILHSLLLNLLLNLLDSITQLVLKSVDGEKLSLTGVLRSDMGGYLCIASNGIPPSVSKRYQVQVNCK
jgi:hypothetical protein